MLGSRSAREDAGVGRFCTRVAPTTGAELCWGPLGSAQRGGAEAAGTWGGPNSAGSKGWAQVGAGGPCPHRAGRERESEQREAELDVLLPSLQLRQTPRALQNDEGIKPLFYLILRLRI